MKIFYKWLVSDIVTYIVLAVVVVAAVVVVWLYDVEMKLLLYLCEEKSQQWGEIGLCDL